MIRRKALGLCLLAVGCGHCGARTALRVPDVSFEDVSAQEPDRVVPSDVAPESAVDVAPRPDVGLPSVDPSCPATCPYTALSPEFPPFVPLALSNLPPTCTAGFELGGVDGTCNTATYTLRSTRPGGARAVTLEVEFATYLAPDGLTVKGLDAQGESYLLLLSCRLQTSRSAGPSNRRPAEDTIRQFRLEVREGTTQLMFDFGAVTSPMYLKVQGLCDFALTEFALAEWWQPLP